MRKTSSPSFFAVQSRTVKLTAMGDPLVTLDAQTDGEAFRCDLARVHEKATKRTARAKPIDVVLMFKLLVQQQRYHLADDEIEYPVRERLSLMRFLGLQLEDRPPDAKTARLVEAPRQRHSREENIQIKAGTPPADWPGKKQRPKNCGALDEEASADPRR